jgi:hypothetical protein
MGEQEEKVNYRNLQTICCVSNLRYKFHGFLSLFASVEDTQIAAEFLQQATVCSYENNCPLWTTGGKRKIHWWSPQLGRPHWETRKLLNNANRTGVPSDWESFREAQG